MDFLSKCGISGVKSGAGMRKTLCLLLLLSNLLPVLDGQYYDFEPVQDREFIINPREVKGIRKSRLVIIPRPPLYENGKMCANGQPPWDSDEMILLQDERQRLADEVGAYNWFPTIADRIPREWVRSEKDYMDLQVDRLYKTHCKTHRCSYVRDYLTGICGSTRILAQSKWIILTIGLLHVIMGVVGVSGLS